MRKIFFGDTRKVVVSVLLSLCYVLLLLFSFWNINGGPLFGKAGFAGIGILAFVLFYLLVSFLLTVRGRMGAALTNTRLDRFVEKKLSPGLEFLLAFLLLLLFTLPAFLALFPGTFGNDGPVEMNQVMTGWLTAHHPLIHISFLVGCFRIGLALTGTYTAGVILASVIQGLVMLLIFAYSIFWMRKRGIPVIFRLIALVFLGWNPYIQMLLFNTTKDTLFTGFFLLMVLHFLDMMRGAKDGVPVPKSKYVAFVLSAVMVCLFRKQGYIILAFVLLFGVFLFWKRNKKGLLAILIAVIAGWFLMGPAIDLMGIEKGDAREMYSVPMQQLARVWNEAEDGDYVLEDADRKLIEELIPVSFLADYNETNADHVKSGFDTEQFDAHKGEYIKLYLKLLGQHPRTFLTAFTRLNGGFYDPSQHGAFASLLFQPTYTDPNFWDLPEQGEFREMMRELVNEGSAVDAAGEKILTLNEPYLRYLRLFADGPWENPFRVLCGQALPVWLMLFLLAAAIYQKNRVMITGGLILFGQWGIQLLGPAMLIRYAMPLIVCLPLLAAFFFVGETAAFADTCTDPQAEKA